MNDMDRLLERAGERWRAAQPNPPDINAAALATRRGRRRSPMASLVAAAVSGAALVLMLVLAASALGVWPRSDPGLVGTGGQPCDVTRPIPPFVPPRGYLAEPPPLEQSAWFGTARLWTMLNPDGEIWKQNDLPGGPNGLTQKTFWWSADWTPAAELEPAITVTGQRLDGAGTFSFGPPGTNASADFGTAMLVGIDIPTPGCWRLTGTYRGASLSYTIWIQE